MVNGILRGQAGKRVSVKPDGIKLVIQRVGAFRHVVCHKIDGFCCFIDPDQLLYDQLLMGYIEQIALTSPSLAVFAVTVKMGKAVSLTLPEG